MNNRMWAVPVATALLVLCACSSQTPGSPSSTTSGTASAPTTSASGGSPLASVDPCSLIAPSKITQAGLQKQPTPSVPGGRGCEWQKPDSGGATDDSYSVEVDVYETSGLNGMNTQGTTASDYQVGSHPGKLLRNSTLGSCILGIGVTASSRVDIEANAAEGDITSSCRLEQQIAPDVVPNLPAYSG